MADHFDRQATYGVARKLAAEYKGAPAGQIYRRPCFAFIHRHDEPVAANSTFVAKGLPERGAEADGRVLDRVMLVDVQVALA